MNETSYPVQAQPEDRGQNRRTKWRDILRKLAGLRRLRVERGASPMEAENALHISEEIMRKHRISPDDIIRFELREDTKQLLDWKPWAAIAERQGMTLDKFGRHGRICLPDGTRVFVNLRAGNAGSWSARCREQQIAAGTTIDRLEKFLARQARRHYSLFG